MFSSTFVRSPPPTLPLPPRIADLPSVSPPPLQPPNPSTLPLHSLPHLRFHHPIHNILSIHAPFPHHSALPRRSPVAAWPPPRFVNSPPYLRSIQPRSTPVDSPSYPTPLEHLSTPSSRSRKQTRARNRPRSATRLTRRQLCTVPLENLERLMGAQFKGRDDVRAAARNWYGWETSSSRSGSRGRPRFFIVGEQVPSRACGGGGSSEGTRVACR